MRSLLLLLLFNFWLFGEVIEKFHTDLVVIDNQKVLVKESIRYNFGNQMKHGIYLDIPKNDTRIKNIKITQNRLKTPYKLFRKEKFYRIRIGDPNRVISGHIDYRISFTLEGVIVRKFGDKNGIIFDFIGTGWRTPIKEASGRLFLPIELQKGKLIIKAFRGTFGAKREIEVQRTGSIIEFHTLNLQPHEGVTLSIKFDPSLMEASSQPSDAYYKNPLYYLFLAPIIALFYYFAKRYNFFGDIGSIAPRYHPPKDLTLLEAGLLKDNFVDFDEVKSTILELANLGYLKIETIDGKLYLHKIEKDISKLTKDQQTVYNALFEESELVANNELKIEKSHFEDIRKYLHESLVQKGYFGSKVSTARHSFLFAAIFTALLSIGGFFYYIFRDSGFEAIVPILSASFFIGVGIANFIGGIKSRSIFVILFSTVWILFSLFFLATSLQSKDLLISIGLMLAVIAIGTYMIYKRMNTLTFKGVLAKRHLLGLKEFIDKAEKDKIKFFLKEDPHFLDKLLPYALLFGLNKHWLQLYQELDTPLPQWYEGDINNFTTIDFEPHQFDPNSNSFDGFTPNGASIDIGDFSDFGDFSGGGFGGGGGDSW